MRFWAIRNITFWTWAAIFILPCIRKPARFSAAARLLAMEAGCFEVAKMAIDERYRGQGLGRQMLRGTIEAARKLGARRLYLVTHHSLKNAIGLYESEGFVHLRPEDAPPSPYARATVFMEKYL